VEAGVPNIRIWGTHARQEGIIIPAVIFFLVFYMAMPVLAEFTTVLDGQAIGALNWAYVYGFAQFLMTGY
jgi:uncharacterized membrane protein (DUF485 family)